MKCLEPQRILGRCFTSPAQAQSFRKLQQAFTGGKARETQQRNRLPPCSTLATNYSIFKKLNLQTGCCTRSFTSVGPSGLNSENLPCALSVVKAIFFPVTTPAMNFVAVCATANSPVTVELDFWQAFTKLRRSSSRHSNTFFMVHGGVPRPAQCWDLISC